MARKRRSRQECPQEQISQNVHRPNLRVQKAGSKSSKSSFKIPKGFLLLIIFVVSILIVAGLVLTKPVQPPPMTQEDVFYGYMKDTQLTGEVLGEVLADKDCKRNALGLTNCTAEINGYDGKFYRFNYEHDMSNQPCLSLGDKVKIKPLTGSKAVLYRLSFAGGHR